MPSNINKEKTQETINLILEKIGTGADQALLAEYLSLFKKEVSLFHRSKVAAYLLMLVDQAAMSGKNLQFTLKNTARKTESFRPSASRDQYSPASVQDSISEAPPRILMSEEESKRLFFSVGRSRRVFPREIIGLITAKTSVSREDIGAIRILDNYSFVQVRDTVAEQIIETLNGINFRGRPLTVNYAKSRKDDEELSDDYQDHSEEEDI